jgi:Domain of unknown function (DUF1864)
MFLEVCEAHGRTAAQHHDQLVSKFIVAPAEALPVEYLKNITASGTPLDVLLRSLENLRDLRLAANRRDIPGLSKLDGRISTNGNMVYKGIHAYQLH